MSGNSRPAARCACPPTGARHPRLTRSPVSAPPACPPPRPQIAVIYYSTYGHVAQLAKKIKEGLESVEGVQVRVPHPGCEPFLAASRRQAFDVCGSIL